MTVVEATNIEIERDEVGSADEAEINERIRAAWETLIRDPSARGRVAATLSVDVSQLDPRNPPAFAKQSRAGLTGGEIIIYMAATFGTGVLSGAGEAVGQAILDAIKNLWKRDLRKKVSPLGSGVLGKEKIDSKD
ncbi:hypothetical protein IB276_35550 [Ensifer sp. ENS04]|uniref:hypothetical protein n=1 Tax=Ensifer sp. ENS04 TaxID=2769281 RepID=UPI00177D5F8E|nr:hypothetical protein [Ensifer sp. ENS04]MBD9544749.1 hypothetical protein [Ensifer sp. ENS04]